MALVRDRKAIGELLLDEGLINEKQLSAALRVQQEKGGQLGQILVEMGVVDQDDVLLALGHQAGMEVVDLDDMAIPDEVVKKVSPVIANTYHVMPVRFENNVLTVAMANPLEVNALDDLRAFPLYLSENLLEVLDEGLVVPLAVVEVETDQVMSSKPRHLTSRGEVSREPLSRLRLHHRPRPGARRLPDRRQLRGEGAACEHPLAAHLQRRRHAR